MTSTKNSSKTTRSISRLLLAAAACVCISPSQADDPVAKPQTTVATLPSPGKARRNQVVFHHDDALYVFGGNRSLEPRDFSPEVFVDDAYRIDLKDHSVRKLTPPPVPMMAANEAVVVGEQGPAGYVFGGLTHDGERFQVSDRIFRYDFGADAWKELDARLPSARTLFGLAQKDGRFWMFGGWMAEPEAQRRPGPGLIVTDQVLTWQAADPDAAVEAAETPLPLGRRSSGAAHGEGMIYLLGGLDDGFDYVIECHRLDTRSGEWSTFPSPERARAMPQVAWWEGKLYVAGGFSFGEIPESGGVANPFESNVSLEVYDPHRETWSEVLAAVPQTEGGSTLRMFPTATGLLVYAISQDEKHEVALIDIGLKESAGDR